MRELEGWKGQYRKKETKMKERKKEIWRYRKNLNRKKEYKKRLQSVFALCQLHCLIKLHRHKNGFNLSQNYNKDKITVLIITNNKNVLVRRHLSFWLVVFFSYHTPKHKHTRISAFTLITITKMSIISKCQRNDWTDTIMVITNLFFAK